MQCSARAAVNLFNAERLARAPGPHGPLWITADCKAPTMVEAIGRKMRSITYKLRLERSSGGGGTPARH
eukprot:12791253-Alexandrium_andersonii.AAC.1